MKCPRKLLAVAAATVMTTAAATPAMALENEFHGMYELLSVMSNFNQTPNTPESLDGGYYPQGNPKNARTATYFEQRARLMYIAKASDTLRLVTQFEINADWGDNAYSSRGTYEAGTMGGGAVGSDSINFRTRQAYLDFGIPATPLRLKVGIQPVADAYKSVILDSRAAGVLASAPIGNSSVKAGFFRFNDQFYPDPSKAPNATPLTSGNATADYYLLEGKLNPTKNLSLGVNYNLYYSDIDRNLPQARTNINMLGVNAEAVFDAVTLNGFAVYQFGKDLQGKTLNAWACNLGSQVKAGPGSVHTEFLYLSGDNHAANSNNSNAFFVMQSSDRPGGFILQGYQNGYDAHLQILGRDPYALVTDNSIVFDNNHGQGVFLGSIGYDLPISDRLLASANAGFAAVAKSNANAPNNRFTNAPNSSNYLGTEMNVSLEYKMYKNLSVIPRFAYVILGDYYKDVASDGTPDNPYMASLVMSYTF